MMSVYFHSVDGHIIPENVFAAKQKTPTCIPMCWQQLSDTLTTSEAGSAQAIF
jgi:hypothetical protein